MSRRPPSIARLAHQASADPDKFLKNILTQGDITPDKIRLIQKALRDEEYTPGRSDGIWGRRTTRAIAEFVKDNPEILTRLSPDVKRNMRENGHVFAGDQTLGRSFDAANPRPQNIPNGFENAINFPVREGNFRSSPLDSNKNLLHPHVAMMMDIKDSNDPRLSILRTVAGSRLDFAEIQNRQSYVRMTLNAAERHGLNGNMLVNQFWQESKFDAEAGSHKGARGIAQIVPRFHMGRLGLNSINDFIDPRKSIEAGAQHMADLRREYGTQSKALIAYNGGPNAITYGGSINPNASDSEWMRHIEGVRATHGTGNPNRWHTQTYDYVRKIDPRYWDGNLLTLAQSTDPRNAPARGTEASPPTAIAQNYITVPPPPPPVPAGYVTPEQVPTPAI